LHRFRVQEPVRAVRGFEPPASDQCADRAGCGQRVGKPELPADLGRGLPKDVAHLDPARDGREEGVRPAQTFVVHGLIMPDADHSRPVPLWKTPRSGRSVVGGSGSFSQIGGRRGRYAQRVSDAVERWGRLLRGREIPAEILKAAPESPWGFPAELFRRRAEAATIAETTPTTRRALEALPQ